MRQPTVILDDSRRQVRIGDRASVLQEKAWQVLQLLINHAPNCVSREAIIEQVWAANALTGEKGLNQAIWQIRAALGDSSRQPRSIRTLPRHGYQWIGRYHRPAPTDAGLRIGRMGIAATVTMLGAMFMLVGSGLSSGEPDNLHEHLVATQAYRVGPDVHVEFDSGCLGIIKNQTGSLISSAVLSETGRQLALEVHKESQCRLVTVDFNTREKSEFGACPEFGPQPDEAG